MLIPVLSPPASGGGQVGALSVLVPTDHNSVRPYTSASFAPSADSQVFVVVSNTGSVNDTSNKLATDVTSTFAVTAAGWSIYQSPAPGVTAQTSTHVWTARTTSSPGSGTVTINSGATPAASAITILEMTGADATAPINGAVSTQAAGGTSISLDTAVPVATGDAVLIFGTSRNDSDGMTSTMTEVVDSYRGSNPSATQYAAYRTGSTSSTADISGMNTVHNSAVAFHVVAGTPTGGPTTYSGIVPMTAPSTLITDATPDRAAAVTMAAPSALSVTAVREVTSAVSMSAPSTIGVDAVSSKAGTVSMTAPSTLAADATVVSTKQGVVAMTAPSTLAADAQRTALPSVAMSAPSTLVVAAVRASSATVAMVAPSALSAAGVRATASSVAMLAPSVLAVGGVRTTAAAVTMSASSVLAGDAVAGSTSTVTMTAPSMMIVLASRTTFAVVAMSAPSTLAAAGVRTKLGAVAMTAPSALAVAGVRLTAAAVAMTAPSTLVSGAVRAKNAAVVMTALSVLISNATKSSAPSSPFYLWTGSVQLPLAMSYWTGVAEVPLTSFSVV